MRRHLYILAVIAALIPSSALAATWQTWPTFLGDFADDTAVDTHIGKKGWDDGGNCQEPMLYHNLTANTLRFCVDGSWAESDENTQIGQWVDQDLTEGAAPTLDGSNITGIPVAGAAVITPSMTELVGNVYEFIDSIGGGNVLRLARHTDFPYTRDIADADSEYGWTWLNRGAMSSGSSNEDDTEADGCYLRHGATATDWYSGSGTYTGPFRYRTLKIKPGETVRLTARISGNMQAAHESCHLMVEGPSNGQYVKAGVYYHTSGLQAHSIYATTADLNSITSGQRDAGVWLSIVIARHATGVDYSWGTYYSVADQATPPALSDMTAMQERDTVTQFTSGNLRVGFEMITANTNDTLEAEVKYLEIEDGYDLRATHPWEGTALWGASQYSTTGTEQVVVQDYDLNGLSPTLASLRQVLEDAENTLPGDSATITWDVVLSDSPAASCDTFQAADVLTVDGSGDLMTVCLEMDGDGDQSGSVNYPILLPLE